MKVSELPWDFGTAREKALDAEKDQKAAEDALRVAWRDYAKADGEYRVELAVAMLKLKASGTPATVCRDFARGQEHIAELKGAVLIAEGKRDAAQAAVWRHTSNRKDARGFANWAERRELAEGYGDTSPWDPESGEIRPRVAA